MTTRKLKSLSWGEIPSIAAFRKQLAAFRDDEGRPALPMVFGVWPDDVLVDAINEGVDSHLEAVQFKQGRDSQGRIKITIDEPASLRTLVRRLAERVLVSEEDESAESEQAGSWATDIMGAAGFEWV